jgi:urease gamma subunit
MIHIEVKFLEELYYPSLTPIFEFRDKNDERIFFILIQIIQTKLSKDLKINVNEVLAIYCSHIVNELRAKTCVSDIQEKVKKLLSYKNVMIGVPEMLKNTHFTVQVDNIPKTLIILKEPIKIMQYTIIGN